MSKTKLKIRFLKDTFGNSKGDEVVVKQETDGEFYYYDSFRRWCYVKKLDEGKDFEKVKLP